MRLLDVMNMTVTQLPVSLFFGWFFCYVTVKMLLICIA